MPDVITLYDDTRRQLIALAAIPNPDAEAPRDGIRFAGNEAIALDSYCVGVTRHGSGPVRQPRILPAKPLAQALKMADKDDLVRIIFGDRQAIVTVGSPTLPLDNPDDDEGLPPVSVDLTYLDDDAWPDVYPEITIREYGVPFEAGHHILSAERLAKLAKLNGGGGVRLEAPAEGGAWRVTTAYSSQVLGYLQVSRVDDDREVADA